MARVENICVSTREHPNKRTGSNLYRYLTRRGGFGFLRTIAVMLPDRIDIYTFLKWKKRPKLWGKKPEISIPVVLDSEPIDGFPDRLAIETENIDLLRELIARGKMVTWILPNLVKFAHILPQLKFEHVVVNPFTENDLVFPTGEYCSNFFGKGKEEERRNFRLIRASRLPFAKMLGYNTVELSRRFDLFRYRRIRWEQGKGPPSKYFIKSYFASPYYNILSITYMLCKKSFVMNVKKKPVPRG